MPRPLAVFDPAALPLDGETRQRGLRVRRVSVGEWAVFHPSVRATVRRELRGFALFDEAGWPQSWTPSFDGALDRVLELYGRVTP